VSTGSGQQKAEKTQKTRAGDVRFLDQARRTLVEIRALSGLPNGSMLELAHVDALTIEQREAQVDFFLEAQSNDVGEDTHA